MKRSLFIIAFLVLLSQLTFGQKREFKLISAYKQEPVSFALIESDDQLLTNSDINGIFVIPDTIEKIRVLHPEYADLLIYPKKADDIIALDMQAPVRYDSTLGRTPYKSALTKLTLGLQERNYENLDAYITETYSRLTISNISYHLDSLSAHRKAYDRHIFLMENLIEQRYLEPNNFSERVLASKISGIKDPAFSLLMVWFHSVNMLEDEFRIGKLSIKSPFYPETGVYDYNAFSAVKYAGSNDQYEYIHYQSGDYGDLDVNGWMCFKNRELFWMSLNYEEKITETQIRLVQSYQHDNAIYPEYTLLNVNFNRLKIENQPLKGFLYSRIVKFDGDPVVDDDFIKNYVANIDGDTIADERLKDFWKSSSSEIEDNTYSYIDSISESRRIENRIKRLFVISEGKIPAGYLNVDVSRLIKFNDHEGWRFGIGMESSSRFSERFTIGGNFAYGLKDQQPKFGVYVGLNPVKLPYSSLKLWYLDDVKETAGINVFEARGIFSDNRFRHSLINRMDEIMEMGLSFQFKPHKNMVSKVSVLSNFVDMFGDYSHPYYGGPNYSYYYAGYNKHIIKLDLIYSPGTYSIRGNKYRLDLRQSHPLLWLSATGGIHNIAGDKSPFYRFDAKVKKTFKKILFGKPGFLAYAGATSPKLPLSELYNGFGSYRSFVWEAPFSFAGMRMNEFISDRFVYFFGYYDFGALDLGIPVLKPKMVLSFHAGIGSLKNPEHINNIEFKTMEIPYLESGIRFNEIINLELIKLGLSAYYRFGYHSLPTFKENIAAKFTMVFPFQSY